MIKFAASNNKKSERMKTKLFTAIGAGAIMLASCSSGAEDKSGEQQNQNQSVQSGQSVANYKLVDDQTQYPRSFVAVQDVLFHLFELLNHVGMDNADIRDGGSDPASGKQMRADFPNNPVVGGPTLNGVLDAYFSAAWGSPKANTYIKTFFEDFNIEGVLPQDTVYFIYRGLNDKGGKHFSMVANNARLIFPDNSTLLYSIRMELLEAEGFNSLERNDNIYQYTGFFAARTRSGKPFQANVVKALQKNTNCRYPVAGVLQIRIDETGEAFTIDFGQGACDAIISIKTPEGESQEIRLDQ